MFFVLSQAWDKEKFWVPTRNPTSEIRIPHYDANYHLATPWWTRPPLGSYAIRVLDTTRIRNVASVMFDETLPSLFLNWAQNLPSFLFYWQTSFSTLDNCNILHCCRQLFFSILNNRLAIACGCYAYLSKLFLFLVSNVRVRVKKPSPTVRQTSVTY